jgi:hypothetical protein
MTPGPAWTGFQFLQGLLGRLGGPRYDGPRNAAEKLGQLGVVRQENGSQARLATPARAGRFDSAPAAPQDLHVGDGYLLMLRDVAINHHIIDKEIYSKGIGTVYQHPGYPISEDKLFMSDLDAAALGVTDGDIIEVASGAGLLQKPVSIKEGLRPGVLEYLVFRDRGEALKLMGTSAKWVAVRVRKG